METSRILIVDDEAAVLNVLTCQLGARGHVVGTATSGAAALKLVSGHFRAALLDIDLPDMTGPELHWAIARRNPDLGARTWFMTGGHHPEHIRNYVVEHGRGLFRKPFSVQDLLAAIEEPPGSGQNVAFDPA